MLSTLSKREAINVCIGRQMPTIIMGIRFASSAAATAQKSHSSTATMPADARFIFPSKLHDNLPKARNTHLVKMRDPSEVVEGKFLTKAPFPHPGYAKADMEAVHYEHRECKHIMDYVTYGFIRGLRRTFDFCTGYIEPKDLQDQIRIANSSRRMTPEKWLARVIVLESVAAIPGSVASFLRHLQALRLYKRDKGFIQTLLDEAYNEKMHLLTFLKVAKPSLWTRCMLYVGQGIFANLFFITYVVRPQVAHRFVGYLEEEATLTYTRCLQDMKLGLDPGLYHTPVPKIAKEYWHMKDDCTFYDLILYIRADEAIHREVNHTYGNLKLRGRTYDRNPFAVQDKTNPKPQPTVTLKNHHGKGWERKDLIL